MTPPRTIVAEEAGARAELATDLTRPAWLTSRRALPFQDLSGDEFEVVCYLLLLRESSDGETVVYYGKTADGGRDIVRTLPDGTVELIQCKRYTGKVGLPDVRAELAKLCTNLFTKRIPTAPSRVVFYAVPDLTSDAIDLLASRHEWIAACEKALEQHLKETPKPELVEFAKAWWPAFGHEDEHKLTLRSRAHPALIEEFFSVQPIITGSVSEIDAGLTKVVQLVARLTDRIDALHERTPPASSALASPTVTGSQVLVGFETSSLPLLSWPTDFGKGEWLSRPEYQTLRERIDSSPHSTSLLLGGPGSGKSALLAKLGSELVVEKIAVLGIKADLLSDTVNNAPALANYLALPAGVEDCVRNLAASGKVVVLIDQLDALANVIDLRSGRLNVLLNLVRALDGIPNVHVVCSCREFERRRDARLAAIQADVVELSLPTWEQVAVILEGRSIATAGWPSGFQELLRPPQHLKVFLQTTGTGAPRPFESYQLMLDELWTKRVTNPTGSPGRSDLLADIATAMAERENLWVPIALFEGKEPLVEELVGAQILVIGQGAAIGFAHQTLFEHAWARAFARQKCSLADYVLARQHGLFVRATLWAGLNYLRGADRTTYRREFARLWDRVDLRRHLRHLMLEFLGQVQGPDTTEEKWLFASILAPDLASRALASVRGNRDWFVKLSGYHLPRLMRASSGALGGLLSAVISSAWATDRPTCLALVRDEWGKDANTDELTFRTLMSLPTWDVETVDLLCTIVERTGFNRSTVLHVAGRVSDSDPNLAPRVLACSLRGEIDRLEQTGVPAGGADETDTSAQQRARSSEQVDRLIRNNNDWYGIEELAERAPGAFVREMWPLLIRMLDHTACKSSKYWDEFRPDRDIGFDFNENRREYQAYPLPEAFEVAVCGFAQRNPADFLKFIESEGGCDSQVLQALLARGLASVGAAGASRALQFLIEDPRRFRLGPFSDEFSDTLFLIRAIVPHLADADIARLERAILSWQPRRRGDDDDDEIVTFREQYTRRDRLRLLTAIPRERLSQDTHELIDHDASEFPDHAEAGVHRIECGFIGSPVSAAEMAELGADGIVGVFAELHDQTEWDHPRDWRKGGSVQAAREFQVFAKDHPAEAASVLARFEPGKQERPAGAGLVGLAESNCPDGDLYDLILALDARGFCGEEFRADAASAMAKRLREKVGLPERMTGLIERWLSDPWSQHPLSEPSRPAQPPLTPASVLWDTHGIGIPHGICTVLRTLTYGYLRRDPPATKEWLTSLEGYLVHSTDGSAWQALAHDLRCLNMCAPKDAVRFIRNLFTRFPNVLASHSGVMLLTHVWWFAPEDDVWVWFDQLRKAEWAEARQGYGELVALRAQRFPTDQRAVTAVRSLLAPDLRGGTKHLDERIGLALAAAHLWGETQAPGPATDILVGLIPGATERLARAILVVFRCADGLDPSDGTHRLLAALVETPPILQWLDEGWLLERLEGLLPHEAEAVHQICRELIRLHSAALGSLQSGWAMHASRLTTIAITLQRMDGPLREQGLELFETLLDLHLPDADAALLEVDQRLPLPLIGLMPRPRAPRRRRKRPAG